MKMLNVEVLRKAAGMSSAQLAALFASFTPVGEEFGELAGKSDVMLLGKTPAVGGAYVNPRYVGGVDVRANYPGRGRVGAAAEMVQQPGAQPVQYSQQQYVAGDVTWMGLGASLPIASLATVSIPVRPPRPFVPQQLYCPSTVQGLLVREASIGGTNIFCGSDGVPVELLSEVSTVPMIEWPTLDPAVGITFVIFNPTGGPLIFSGALYGTQVRQ